MENGNAIGLGWAVLGRAVLGWAGLGWTDEDVELKKNREKRSEKLKENA